MTRIELVGMSTLLIAIAGCAGQHASSPPVAPILSGLYRVCVDKAGSVSSVDAIEPLSAPDLDAKVRTQTRSWKFRPAVTKVGPVPFCEKVRFVFDPGG